MSSNLDEYREPNLEVTDNKSETSDEEETGNPEVPEETHDEPGANPAEEEVLSELLNELNLAEEELGHLENPTQEQEESESDELSSEKANSTKTDPEMTDNTIATVIASSRKGLVPDLGFFDGTHTKFDNWWRAMTLFMKFNKIVSADDKAIAVLARRRGGTAGAYAAMRAPAILESEDSVD